MASCDVPSCAPPEWRRRLIQSRTALAATAATTGWTRCPAFPTRRSAARVPFALPRPGHCDNLGAGEVTVLDLEDSEGLMRLAGFVRGSSPKRCHRSPKSQSYSE